MPLLTVLRIPNTSEDEYANGAYNRKLLDSS